MARRSDAFTNNIGYKKLGIGKTKLKQYDFPPMVSTVSKLELPHEADPNANVTTRT